MPAGGPPLGFPVFATKNTTRVAGGDAIADAAAIALATYPAAHARVAPAGGRAGRGARLADRARGLGAGQPPDPRADPVRRRRHDPGRDARPRSTRCSRPAPRRRAGRRSSASARRRRVEGYKTTDVTAANPAALAAAVDRLQAAAAGRARRRRRSSPPRTARSTRCPRPAGRRSPATRCCGSAPPACRRRPRPRSRPTSRPRSTSSGPPDAVPDTVLDALEKLGTSSASRAPTRSPTRSRSRASRTATSAGTSSTPATASCSPPPAARRTRRPPRRCRRTGTYGPLLLLTDAGVLPAPLQDYLLDIQPGYDRRPGARRLQPRLDRRRRERDRRRGPGAHRYALGDPARRHRSRVSPWPKPSSPNACVATARSPWTTSARSRPPRRRTSRYQIRNRIQKLIKPLAGRLARAALRRAGDRAARAARLHRRGPRHARAGRHARAAERERARAAALHPGATRG